ncbi:MAG: hypothetical protein HY675_08740 [Chloroflexi bacterium]|nr:hypothetical protein [Chloroflexota bacterium]
MAQLTTGVRERIEFLLDHLIQEWENLPRAEREIDQWDLIEQIDYIEEWTPTEGLRHELEGYAAKGLLDSDQQARYEKLQRLVAENRPILNRLRES